MSRPLSFRIDDKLYERLDRVARRGRRSKSGVIARALEDYLDRHECEGLAAEARRQSLIASAQRDPGETDWLAEPDETGWE